MIRRTMAVCAALTAASFASTGSAGDDANHSAAGQQAVTSVAAAFGDGVCGAAPPYSVSFDECPWNVGDPASIGYRVTDPDHNWWCAGLDGFSPLQLYNLMPADIMNANALMFPSAVTTFLVQLGSFNAYLTMTSPVTCNWTHFTNNAAIVLPDGSHADNTWAHTTTMTWADAILAHIQSDSDRYTYQDFCNADSFTRLQTRVMNAGHFIHDQDCPNHAGGNINCDPGNGEWSIPLQSGPCETYLDNAYAQSIYSATSAALPAGPLPAQLACDLEMISGAAPKLSGNWLTGYYYSYTQSPNASQLWTVCQAGSAGSAISCAGLERLYSHHCQQANPAAACAGGVNDPTYCECGAPNTAVSPPGYVTQGASQIAGDLTTEMNRWQSVCTPPPEPCDPGQCDQWCRFSTALASAPTYWTPLFGVCTASPADTQACQMTTCTCLQEPNGAPAAQFSCGNAGQPGCRGSAWSTGSGPWSSDQGYATPCFQSQSTPLALDPSTGLCQPCGGQNQICCGSGTYLGQACQPDLTCTSNAGSCVSTCQGSDDAGDDGGSSSSSSGGSSSSSGSSSSGGGGDDASSGGGDDGGGGSDDSSSGGGQDTGAGSSSSGGGDDGGSSSGSSGSSSGGDDDGSSSSGGSSGGSSGAGDDGGGGDDAGDDGGGGDCVTPTAQEDCCQSTSGCCTEVALDTSYGGPGCGDAGDGDADSPVDDASPGCFDDEAGMCTVNPVSAP
ncbi:MAG TPA: hypothetical protein VF765_08020 [Polyangiaceae bacterium]